MKISKLMILISLLAFVSYCGGDKDASKEADVKKDAPEMKSEAKTEAPKENCDFNCSELGDEAAAFYNTKGEWAGTFTMKVQAIKQKAEGVCHIKYEYVSVPGKNQPSGIDMREFKYAKNGCKWNVTSMGPNMSAKASF